MPLLYYIMKSKYNKELLEITAKMSNSLNGMLQKLGLKKTGGNWNNISKLVKHYQIDIGHFKKSDKYPKQRLQTLAAESVSVSEILKKLNLKLTGGNNVFIRKKLDTHNIDTSHFLGQKANCGIRWKGKRVVLTKRDSGERRNASVLRKALLKIGRLYKCEGENCSVNSNWLGKEIRLQVHHVDGNWLNDDPTNLKLLCPNCHSQTDNYCIKNRRKDSELSITSLPI